MKHLHQGNLSLLRCSCKPRARPIVTIPHTIFLFFFLLDCLILPVLVGQMKRIGSDLESGHDGSLARLSTTITAALALTAVLRGPRAISSQQQGQRISLHEHHFSDRRKSWATWNRLKMLPILQLHNFASTHLADIHGGRKKDVHLALALNTAGMFSRTCFGKNCF